jgi:hypothetical protein
MLVRDALFTNALFCGEIVMAERPSQPNDKEYWYDREQVLHRVEEKPLRDYPARRVDPDDFSAVGGPENEHAYGRTRNDVGDYPFDGQGGPYDRDEKGYEQERGGYIKKHYADFDPAQQSGPFRGYGPRTYRKSDARLHEDVCEALTADEQLDARNIEVSVADGIVRLVGRAQSNADRRRAEELSARCAGVLDVQNQIKVKADTVPPQA